MTLPIRFLGQILRRPKKYIRAFQITSLNHGGAKGILVKAWRVYKVSGLAGIKNSFRNLLNSGSKNILIDGRPSQVISSYADWFKHFDTPGDDWIAKISKEITQSCDALILIYIDEFIFRYSEITLRGVMNLVGINWKAQIVLSNQINNQETIEKLHLIVHGDARFYFNGEFDISSFDAAILLEAGVLLEKYSAYLFRKEMQENPSALIVYSDEDKISLDGELSEPWFKPKFSPLLAQQGVLWGGAVAFSLTNNEARKLVSNIVKGDVNPSVQFQEYSSSIPASSIAHIPHVLFHSYLKDTKVRDLKIDDPQDLPLVSIIIPTRDMWSLLQVCLKSLEITDWPKAMMEIIVIDNASTDSGTLKGLRFLQAQDQIKVIRVEEEFNWSRLNNIGVQHSSGELLIFLNNDTEVLDPKWVKKILKFAVLPDVGAVGCKLLYLDLKVQHGGVVAGIHNFAGHAHLLLEKNEGGYKGLANITHEVIAVTGACLAVMRDRFESVGGFDETFKVAFNDVVFCFDQHQSGRRNIYIGEPLLIHHESKSRGYDDTPLRVRKNILDAMRVWEKYSSLMHEDPYYSPKLSLEIPYGLSEFPRRRAKWGDSLSRPKRILMLSITHQIGHGVPVVLHKQAMGLVEAGFEVIVAGPRSGNDFDYLGCEFIELSDPKIAAKFAVERDIDLVIAHTPPFFSVARWLGKQFPVISYDYGEPPAAWFPDSEARENQLLEKDFSLSMAKEVYAISEAVKMESRTPVAGVIKLSNSHLGQWDKTLELERRRNEIRKARHWEGIHVVMNVCRFHRAERIYKGVDFYISVRDKLFQKFPHLKGRVIFIICGKGNEVDVQEMLKAGLKVFNNVTDDEMIDLYIAADSYANFSRWEGYNLGIGQAMAMGLPVISSDISAHRAFGEKVVQSYDEAADWIAERMNSNQADRTAKIWEWKNHIAEFKQMVSKNLNNS